MTIPYFDAHCDTITAAMAWGEGLRENNRHLDLARMSGFGPAAQVFAIFTRPRHDAPPSGFDRKGNPFDLPDAPEGELLRLCDEAMDCLLSELQANADLVRLCLSAADIRACAAEGKIAPEDIPGILERGDRSAAGPTAPPGGLYLTGLWYEDERLNG